MQEIDEWEFPESLRPKEKVLSFDLKLALDSVVKIRTKIPNIAFTSEILGTERIGSGVVIDGNGLILTIGYLLTEAESIWVTTSKNQSFEAHLVGYDQSTGFGLIQALTTLSIEHSLIEDSIFPSIGDQALFLSYGGIQHALTTKIVRESEFAGYWEYVIDGALYTSPPHPQWGGAALFNERGRVIGIGSLFLQEIFPNKPQQGNMIIPITLFNPIREELVSLGQTASQPRAWLGMYTVESDQRLIVSSLAPCGPAESAGIAQGDQVIEISGKATTTLAAFFRTVWSLGSA